MHHRKPLAVLIVLALALGAAPTEASVSIALSIDDVARHATLVARVVPLDRTSAWEDDRIVTTTRLRVENVIAGRPSVGDLRVRTRGGVVGDVGQSVEGEPVFRDGEASVVFLAPRNSAHAVVGRAQGQLLVSREAGREIVRVPHAGAIVARVVRAPEAPAGEPIAMLDRRDVLEVSRLAARAWERTHAP